MSISAKYRLFTCVGLLILIAIAYSSSLKASWHLDDFPHIVRNEKIHLTRLDSQSVLGTFFAGPTENFYRPIPMLSFALNWYVHRDNTMGYHLTNLFIHFLNGCLLYLIVFHLLQSPCLNGHFNHREIYWIASATAILWALNPLQTQAVSYIIQRMALMAALFYLGGVYAYIRYKNAAKDWNAYAWLAGCALCYLLAILSKENAVLFPFGLYLIYSIFYASEAHRSLNKRRFVIVSGLLLVTLLIGVACFFFLRGHPLHVIEGLYAERPFTAYQRLLTQPRVLLFYISLLFLPAPGRLSVGHDFSVSTSLLEPWTTSPAILIIGAMIGLAVIYRKKAPLISFAVLFFFINHIVESTLLPLEMVFEHRNYLPSLFLFLPIARGAVRLSQQPFFKAKDGRYLATGAICLTVGMLCNWTFIRNMVWFSEKSLWEYEIRKNPHLSRPHHNLAWAHYQARGKYEEALRLYRKALTLKAQSPFETASTMNNIGRIYYLKGDYEQALPWFQKAINESSQLKIAEYQLVMTLAQLDRFQDALKIIDASLRNNHQDLFYVKMKGILLSRLGADDKSIFLLYKYLEFNPADVDARLHLGLVLSRTGRFDKALGLFPDRYTSNIANPLQLLVLSEIERQKGNHKRADETFDTLIRFYDAETLKGKLTAWKRDNLSVPIDYDHYLSQLDTLSDN